MPLPRYAMKNGLDMHAVTTSMKTSTDGSYSRVLSVIFDVCSCALMLLFGAALMKLLREYRRRKGYMGIQQDDQGMYSNVLMGTSNSWENVCVADSA